MRIGVMVSFVHNASDIMSSVCRGFSQTKYSNVTAVTFISTIAIWIYYRNVALPIMTHACWTMASYSFELESFYQLHYMLSAFLTALCMMHVYWTVLFFKMLYGFATQGKDENIINKTENHEAKKNEQHCKSN